MRQLRICLAAYVALCACAAAAAVALHDGVSSSAATAESGYCRMITLYAETLCSWRKHHSAITAVHPVTTAAATGAPTALLAQKFIPVHTRSAWHHILLATQSCVKLLSANAAIFTYKCKYLTACLLS